MMAYRMQKPKRKKKEKKYQSDMGEDHNAMRKLAGTVTGMFDAASSHSFEFGLIRREALLRHHKLKVQHRL